MCQSFGRLVLTFALLFGLACKDETKVAGPTSASTPPPAAAKTLTKVKLASSKNVWCALPIVAKQRGFFEGEGLDVSVEYVQAAKFAMDALLSSSVDVGTLVEVNIAFLGYTGNTNVTVPATIVESHDAAIVALSDKGIKQPADLKGKALGVIQGTTSQIFAERFLKKYEMTFQDVQIRNLQPVAIQTALIAKELPAGSVWQPFTQNVKSQVGDGAVVFADPTVYTGYMNVAFRKDWMAKNRDTASAFLRALRKAERFLADNPADAQALLAKELNLGLPLVQAIWKDYDFHLGMNEKALLEAITEVGRWINQTQPNFVDKTLPDYSGYLDKDMLNAVTPVAK